MNSIIVATSNSVAKGKNLSTISAVSRSMAVLEALSEQPGGLTVSELVIQLGIEKSVVSRVLATLHADGYLVRDSVTDSFRIGLRFAAIALRHVDSTGISDLCLPLLGSVAHETGELVQLAILQSSQMIYVAKAEGKQRIRVLSLVGRAAVLHASAAGKVWLASLPDDEAIALCLKAGVEQFTDKTICGIDSLRAEFHRVRKNKYATVQEELIEGAAAVGVPVWDRSTSRVLGAVVLSGPAYRLSQKRMVTLVPKLRDLAAQLTAFGNIDIHFNELSSRDPDILKSEERILAS
ncbi:MAG: IclR family transcriptional regulator [Afipia sp.]|nr:IclR family transcriptional regulator [Afipia sp.]